MNIINNFSFTIGYIGKLKPTTKMKQKVCAKCGTYHQLTEHHCHPKAHYHGSGPKIDLCFYCHRRLEDILLGIEAFIGKKHIGERYKLKKEDYENILLSFLPRRQI